MRPFKIIIPFLSIFGSVSKNFGLVKFVWLFDYPWSQKQGGRAASVTAGALRPSSTSSSTLALLLVLLLVREQDAELDILRNLKLSVFLIVATTSIFNTISIFIVSSLTYFPSPLKNVLFYTFHLLFISILWSLFCSESTFSKKLFCRLELQPQKWLTEIKSGQDFSGSTSQLKKIVVRSKSAQHNCFWFDENFSWRNQSIYLSFLSSHNSEENERRAKLGHLWFMPIDTLFMKVIDMVIISTRPISSHEGNEASLTLQNVDFSVIHKRWC